MARRIRIAEHGGPEVLKLEEYDPGQPGPGEARRNPFAYGTLLSAGAYLEQAVQIVIVGEPGSDRFRELHEVAAAAPVPFRVILPLGAHEELPSTHPANGKRLVGGAATAYVCVGTVCEAPITEPDQLRERLTEAGP